MVEAQNWKFYRLEYSLSFGASNFLGELGGANSIGTNFMNDFEFKMTRPIVKLGCAFMINPKLKVSGFGLFGMISGDDATTSEKFRNNRNLHFRSIVGEIGVDIQYFPFQDKVAHLNRMSGIKGRGLYSLSPYIATGVGGMYFNPKAKYTDGIWYALQPLGTEGQGLPSGPDRYSRLQLFIPAALGMKYALSSQLSIGLELSRRFVFTDYLDDVSGVYFDKAQLLASGDPKTVYFSDPSLDPTLGPGDGILTTGTGQPRGDATDNDAYMFALFSIHYRPLQGRKNLPKF